MRLPKAPKDVEEYLQNAFVKSQQWKLPNGKGADDAQSINITKIGVIGGGTMGRGIAISAVRAGYQVVLIENDERALTNACKELETTYSRELKLKRFKQKDVDLLRSKSFEKSTDLNSLKDVDLVIEAVFENLKLKQELFSKLDKICPKHAIFGTNTSSLDIDKMAQCLSSPSRLVGIHFFNPAHVLLVVEIVHGIHTSTTSIATAFSVISNMKKIPILVGNCRNFMFNRLLAAYLMQAHKLMYIYGMYPKEIDRIMTNYGLLMGPITMHDMNGLDVSAKLKSEHNIPLNPIEDALLRENRLGRKNGKGFYSYDSRGQKSNDSFVEGKIDEISCGRNRQHRLFSDADIVQFLLYPMVNEGFLCLEEGIIEDSSLIDLMFIFGFGWPIRHGGPMRWAHTEEGLGKIGESMRMWNAMEPEDRTYKISKALLQAKQNPLGKL